MVEPKIIDNQGRTRFEIYDGEELAGFVEYHLYKDEIAFLHTEVLPQFRERGLAGRLVHSALDAARESALAVLPYCPFVRGWIGKHPDYLRLVPKQQRPRFGL